MKASLILLAVLLCVALSQAEVQLKRPSQAWGKILVDAEVDVAKVNASAAFDFYMIVLQWDTSLSGNFFTIHGLWPENSDGSYPENCAGPKYNATIISDLVSTLNKVWPSNSGSNSDFWKHEWEKHGTCSEFVQRAYFQNSIDAQAKYDILGALAKSSIVPSNSKTYTSASVKSSVLTNIGNNPALHCSSSKLIEVALCLSKNLKLMNCPNALGSYFNNCPTSVSFPAK